MKLKFIQEEDFVNYKECSMFVGTAFCDFKCQKENPKCNCQNSILINSDTQEISISKLIDILIIIFFESCCFWRIRTDATV